MSEPPENKAGLTTGNGLAPQLSTRLNAPYDERHGSPTPPIYQTSLFTFNSYEEMQDRFAEKTDHPLYSRVDNPTVREFESLLAQAEGADQAAAFGSGMAAISASLFGGLYA